MKLIYKNLLFNIIVSLIVLAISQATLFVFIKYKIDKEADEHLEMERHFLLNELNGLKDIYSLEKNIGDRIFVEQIQKIQFSNPIIEEVEVEETEEKHETGFPLSEEERFSSKRIVFDAVYNSVPYRISILKTIDEDEGLNEELLGIMVVSGLILLLLLFVINWFIYKNMLAPFNDTLTKLNSFDITKGKALDLKKSNTKEFEELNTALYKLSVNVLNNYTSLKEFSEDLSHELQTPLTIISNKVELCLQDSSLNEKQFTLLAQTQSSIKKLATLNQDLILLSKLNNGIFETGTDKLSISNMFFERLNYFEDFIENKELKINIEKNNDFFFVGNKGLLEILFDNLLKNAILHTTSKSTITIVLDNGLFSISNPGNVALNMEEGESKRFHADGKNSSLGLGIPIIKKICFFSKISCDYTFSNMNHTFSFKFN